MEEEPQRPKAVTVIGWIWVVVGGLYLLRSVVDLVMWKALQPAAPALLREVERQDPEGLGVSVALASGLIVMIVLLRSSQVRHAFERPDARAP